MSILLDVATVYYGDIDITDDNLDNLDTVLTEENKIGFTKDGLKVEAKPNIRQIEFDGRRERNITGYDRVLGWTVEVECDALEILDRPEALGLVKDSNSKSTKYDVFRPNHDLQYKDLVLVGEIHSSKTPAIIHIHNAFNEGGLQFEQKDSDESAFSLKFIGSYDKNSDKVPMDVYLPKKA